MKKNTEKSKIVLITNLEKNGTFTVGENEKKVFLIMLTDEKDHTGDVKIDIQGSNAHVQILGVIIGSGKQRMNLYTLQDHQMPQSVSDLYIKSVLFDESHFNYKGLIQIEKNAQKSNAYQKNQNLLMSKKAWADSRPELEILANDVRCTHGATVGKIDKEQLYYLQTRGLTNAQATELILQGYFSDILELVSDDSLRGHLSVKIQDRIVSLLH